MSDVGNCNRLHAAKARRYRDVLDLHVDLLLILAKTDKRRATNHVIANQCLRCDVRLYSQPFRKSALTNFYFAETLHAQDAGRRCGGPQRGLMQQSPKLPAYCCRDSQDCLEGGDPNHYSYTVQLISIGHPL